MLTGTIKTLDGEAVKSGVAFTPVIASGGTYYPICRHFFEDNNNGVIAVCKAFGFSSGMFAHKERVNEKLHAMQVGTCKVGEFKLDKCTGGGNHFGDLNVNNGHCHKGNWVVVEVTCSGAKRIHLP